MVYTCEILSDKVKAYNVENECVGIFDYEDFFINVISPLEFKRYERNENKTSFHIRKLEFNNYNLKK